MGSVLVEDCIFEVDGKSQPDSTAVRIVDSEKVTITRCSLKGPDGYTAIVGPGIPGSSGLYLQNSNAYLYGTSVVGGVGADAELYQPLQIVSGSSAGVPGEHVLLLLSTDPGFVYYPDFRGVLVPAIPFIIVSLGALPPSGILTLNGPVNLTFPPGTESLLVYAQVIVQGQPKGGVLSAPTVAVIVDNQF